MAVVQFRRQKNRKRPIKCVFRFIGRPAVIALCWTMAEVTQAFQQARGRDG